ncbi:Mss4-like protein [Collybia nuda]|uniref:Mss4-like protein n=1 Tax=Collybia nuda TaxID=64659 RepID=A0A9P5Y7F8_9AGAR|nr:Mss4-like protein [Collybia nuda]
MPIELSGSCHCGAIKFTVQSSTPIPYQLCFCSICRKVGGVGGSINLGGHMNTLKVEGKEHLRQATIARRVYRAVLDRGTSNESIASSERNFCSKCSSMLWLYDESWPDLVHPFASAIDSPELQAPASIVCIKLDSKPAYVRLPEGEKELYDDYGPDSLEAWHKTNKVYVK